MADKTTHFGYQPIAWHNKTQRVAEVFDSVANNYDVMNDLMSFGIHRLWKRLAIQLCQVRSGQHILDLAGGSGDLSIQLNQRVGSQGQVTLADINPAMLAQGRKKLLDQGIVENVNYVVANAEAMPFDDKQFDGVIIGFGLRNVTDQMAALSEMHRVLKPGGWAMILEFSKPTSICLGKIYDAYSFNILPKLGAWVTNDAASYQYLAESIRMHPDQETLQTMMQETGFANCDHYNLSDGIVAIHKGYKL